MTKDGSNPQPPIGGRGPWWVAAAGGGGGIMAAVMRDHALGWAIVIAFVAWLIHDILIAWLSKRSSERSATGHLERGADVSSE